MNQPATYTRRKKRNATHAAVLLSDKIAHYVITLGGLATIAAVLLVGVFLFVVALPLFYSATSELEQSISFNLPSDQLLASGLDESGTLGWFCNADEISVIELKTGNKLFSRSTESCGLRQASSICHLQDTLRSAFGFEDGTVRTGRLGLTTSYVPQAKIPLLANSLNVGGMITINNVIYLRSSNDVTKKIELLAYLDEPISAALTRPIIDIDLAITTNGFCVAALDDRGNIHVQKRSFQKNLITDESSVSTVETTIKEDRDHSGFCFIRVSGLGDQLFVFTPSGVFKRFVIRDATQPVFMEQRQLLQKNQTLTHIIRLFGGSSFVLGDNSGTTRILFTSRDTSVTTKDGLATKITATFASRLNETNQQKKDRGITAISASPRSRLFAIASADGFIRLLQATNHSIIAEINSNKGSALTQKTQVLLLGSREHNLVAYDGKNLASWNIEPGYPEVSFGSLFGTIWYENYPGNDYAWETTGHDSFEPKFSLVPLLFGTIKATVYSMLFATPIAIFAAIYASQFMTPAWKSRIKPVIEMMASLPSVVLGFIAGLILAPLIESGVMIFITSLFTIPVTLLTGAFLWQFWPPGLRGRVSNWRFPIVLVVALPLGILFGWLIAKPTESLLFDGDFFAWLNGRGASGWGGWVLALFPLSAMVSTVMISRFINPWIRQRSRKWSHWTTVFTAFSLFIVGFFLAGAISTAAAMFLDALRWETRSGIFGTYIQRNTMIVAIGMSFAIIPLIFTIADDALSSVPDHLRSGSLSTGATPWQTTVRILLPTAASGIFSAVMIGLGRAVGETMIVLMAAGNTPIMDWNIFSGFQTLSATIATELPEATQGSTHYRILFLAAVLLFVLTFFINTVAEVVRQRFRRRAHEL